MRQSTPTDDTVPINLFSPDLASINANGSDKHRNLKLPKFCANEPNLWFVQIESVFAYHKIATHIEKSQILMANLDSDTLNCVRHVVLAFPRPEDAYSQNKTRIVFHFAVSDEVRTYQLLRGDLLNSGKPSQVLNQLRCLNDGNISEEILKLIFMTKLPKEHQIALDSSGIESLNELAKRADQMSEIDRINNPTIAAVSEENHEVVERDKIEVVTAEKSDSHRSQSFDRRDVHGFRGRGRGTPFRG